MKNQNNNPNHDDQGSQLEQNIVRLLSGLRWMESQSRTHQAVRQLRQTSSLEFLEHWLTELTKLEYCAGDFPLDTRPPLDRIVNFTDPWDSLSIQELAEMITYPTVISGFSKSLASDECPSPSIRHAKCPEPELTPDASDIVNRWDVEKSGLFTSELIECLRKRLSPEAFEQLALTMEQIGGCYSELKPVYCNTPLAEIIREIRRILKHRWGTDQLTPHDVAAFINQDMLAEVEQSMLQRRH